MSPESRPRLVCRCRGVASPRIFAAARSGRLADVGAVTKSLGAGGGCGLCHPEIEEILREVAGAPSDPAIALENEAVCRAESQAAVERALVRAGARVRFVAVDGLRVEVRLAPDAPRDAERAVREALLRRVCADLAIDVVRDRDA